MHGYKWPINCTRTRTPRTRMYVIPVRLYVLPLAAQSDLSNAWFINDWLVGIFKLTRGTYNLYVCMVANTCMMHGRLRVRGHIISHARNNM
eukprot:COSAG05_NODE_520_length_9047_cov_2.500224_9_plen_91_part_00